MPTEEPNHPHDFVQYRQADKGYAQGALYCRKCGFLHHGISVASQPCPYPSPLAYTCYGDFTSAWPKPHSKEPVDGK